MRVYVAGLGNMFGEKNLKHNMDKYEELKVVKNELWDPFQQHMYGPTFCGKNKRKFCNLSFSICTDFMAAFESCSV